MYTNGRQYTISQFGSHDPHRVFVSRGGTGLPSISLEGVLTFITWVVENFFLIRDLVIYLMFIRHQTLLPGSIY